MVTTKKQINRIKSVLTEQKKTGKWLAAHLNTSTITVSKWCTNTSQPNLQTLCKIAEVLGVNVKDLLNETQEKKMAKDSSQPTFSYTPVEAMGHTPPYKLHKYFARRPYNVFEELIRSYTQKGDTILDPFCGGGVSIYEALKQGRKAIGCDLNPLSIFIVRNMVRKDCLNDTYRAAKEDILKYLKQLQANYLTFSYKGEVYTADWFELAYVVRCPHCNRTIPLVNEYKIKNGLYRCMHQNCVGNEGFKVAEAKRDGFQYIESIAIKKKKRIQKEFDKADESQLSSHIVFLKKCLKENNISVPQDLIPNDWDRQFEDGLKKKGILFFQDFFTKRNLYTLLLLKNRIQSYKDSLSEAQYELLRIAFSNAVKECNNMSFTNDGWQGGRPTTWSRHAYWIPTQFCETNVLSAFSNGLERVESCVNYNNEQNYIPKQVDCFKDLAETGNLLLLNKSVADSDIPDNSIDAIITDPPYGSNVQYLELSHFWFPWNKDLYQGEPDFAKEAISNRKKGFKGCKTQYTYERNLYSVYEKAFHCLKSNRYMTLTFNNKDMSSWLGLMFAIFKAGFSFDNLFFQDGVKNYKQTAHTKAEGSPYGDFIYVFKKCPPSYKLPKIESEADFIEKLDILFKSYLKKTGDRNEIILEMIKESIPLIHCFSKMLKYPGEHKVYEFFKKDYLDKLYEKDTD